MLITRHLYFHQINFEILLNLSLKIHDYITNASPTVEGALQIAMEEMPTTIHGSTSLVLGFGRIGKLLSKSLHSLGSNVSVAARKFSDFAWIKAYGYSDLHFNMLEASASKFNLIINTVPSIIIDKNVLENIKNDCLIIDLASKPGGVDFDYASKLGKKVIWALSLPGSVAPETAGFIIKDTILNLLEELGV